ncbi:MAG: hypothetical protein GYA55_11440, partial [SAR324 cluster bacterium]|nr:hypothetical protein [SAR324 cluster bacterium]
AEEDQILDKWKNFGKRLAALPKHYPTIFETEIITLFLRQLEKYKMLNELSSMLTAIFPSSARLRLGLAESFRRNGKDKEAFEHFCWLSEQKRQHEKNKNFLDGIDLKYIEAWKAVIEARVKGT